MEPVRSLAVKGLIEGLVLHAIEREPTHGYGIIKDLEHALGDRPGKNQIYPLLRELEDGGYVTSEPAEEGRAKQIYRLTERGEERLAAYRSLPPPFKNWLASVFGLPHLRGTEAQAPEDAEQREAPGEPEPPAEAPEAPDEPEQAQTGERPPTPAVQTPQPMDAAAAWVPALLQALPRGEPIKAPYAEISVERAPHAGTWTLTVENHDPGSYEDADACPLTFLYLAMHRLLFDAPLGEDAGEEGPESAQPL